MSNAFSPNKIMIMNRCRVSRDTQTHTWICQSFSVSFHFYTISNFKLWSSFNFMFAPINRQFIINSSSLICIYKSEMAQENDTAKKS